MFVCSQNKLDEALLTSGRVSDALQSLLEWLHKAEATISSEQNVLGDLDTVHMLYEQHRVGSYTPCRDTRKTSCMFSKTTTIN